MPAHDWTRVSPGTFHDFHLAWIAEMRRTLNRGLLPSGYYAQAEQVAGGAVPDVLTLQESGEASESTAWSKSDAANGVVTVAEAPPKVSLVERYAESAILHTLQRHLVIRHSSGDRIVALVEVVSPGNKDSTVHMESFITKALSALKQGYHLLILDLFPPGRFDPEGIHGLVHAGIFGVPEGDYQQPRGRPLTLAAYVAAEPITAYVEPLAVGTELPDMPLFLDPGHYVNVPLEATYDAAYEGVPQRWQRVIEGP